MKKILLITVLCMLVPGITFAGPKWEFGDDSWLKMSILGQVH